MRAEKPTITPTAEDKIYAAGLFDGEGCISINKNSHVPTGKTTRYQMNLSISMCYLPVGTWLRERFGGSYSIKHGDNSRYRMLFVLTLSACQAANFLKEILPYLKVKRKEAEIAIAFQEWKTQTTQHSGSLLGKRGRAGSSPERVKVMEQAYNILRIAKSIDLEKV